MHSFNNWQVFEGLDKVRAAGACVSALQDHLLPNTPTKQSPSCTHTHTHTPTSRDAADSSGKLINLPARLFAPRADLPSDTSEEYAVHTKNRLPPHGCVFRPSTDLNRNIVWIASGESATFLPPAAASSCSSRPRLPLSTFLDRKLRCRADVGSALACGLMQ